jgi:predicted AAA+ superfamily ATPase
MERDAMQSLIAWKQSPYRKPLILQGIRQVGKTWLLKEFGRRYYERVAYFNFDEHPEYRQFFESTKDVTRILDNLQFIIGFPITEGTTLIIFDEIQEAPNVLNALKYFHENGKSYHVACAGSLLGVTLAKPSSFPVGQVDFLKIHPMTFSEMLGAEHEKGLLDYLDAKSDFDPIPEAFFAPLVEHLKRYFLMGGLPEAVARWVNERDSGQIDSILYAILQAYEHDFAKHPEPRQYPKLIQIWRSIPSQLAKENKKFFYQLVREGARAREYEDALHWLVSSDVVTKVSRCTKPALPLSAYEDLSAFKLYTADVALLRRLAQLDNSAFLHSSRLFTEFKGAFTETYILQSLSASFPASLRYWTSSDNRYEVDFLLQYKNLVIPIEVKAETNISSPSLKAIKRLHGEDFPLRVRYSLQNLKLDGDVLNIPLFMVDWSERLINVALEKAIS